MMRLWTLGSGSRGNALLLESGTTRVVVDVGFGPRMLAQRLGAIGVAPQSIAGAIITHEHHDHVRGAAAAARRWGWSVHATAGTLGAVHALAGVAGSWCARDRLTIGDIEFAALPIEHDAAEPIGLVATSRSGARCGIVHDLGRAGPRLRTRLRELDLLVLEANHDRTMLRNGPYPRVVQDRIDGPRGHLSNETAAEVARDCAHPALAHVVLAHISENCNTPKVAQRAVHDGIRRTSFRGAIHAAAQDLPCGPFACGFGRTVQLRLSI